MTFSNAVAAGAAWRSSQRLRRPKLSRAWSTSACRPPLPPSTRRARRPRRNSRSPPAGSEPPRRPMDSSPTHPRPTISAPDTVPCLTTRTQVRGWGGSPCAPTPTRSLFFPPEGLSQRGTEGARGCHNIMTRPVTQSDNGPCSSCTRHLGGGSYRRDCVRAGLAPLASQTHAAGFSPRKSGS